MILIGVVLLGVAILASLGFVNVGLVLERKYVPAFVLLMVLAGLFDTFAAVLIARW